MRAFLFISLALLVSVAQADKYDEVTIRTTDLGHGLFMLAGAGGNLGVSTGADGVFLIDDQFAPLSERILTAIKQVSAQPVKFVLNTHWHPDHTGGNENLGKAGAIIIAHDNVRVRLTQDQFIAAFNMRTTAYPDVALPVVTFSASMTLHLNGNSIQVKHVAAAHTDGDSIVFFGEANVLHMGDTFFSGMYPFIDVSSGGSIDGMIAAADKGLMLANKETKIIPGHGPLSDRAGLEAYREMLLAVRDTVKELIAQGKDRQAVMDAEPTGDFDFDFGTGVITSEVFSGIVFDDLSR